MSYPPYMQGVPAGQIQQGQMMNPMMMGGMNPMMMQGMQGMPMGGFPMYMPQMAVGGMGGMGYPMVQQGYPMQMQMMQGLMQPMQAVQQQVPPSLGQELLFSAFAEQVGIDGNRDQHLAWIVLESWQHPLPHRWEAHCDPEHNEWYYVSIDTEESFWVHPLAPYVRQIVDIARVFYTGRYWLALEEVLDRLKEEISMELENWHGPFSELNEHGEEETYFVNSVTQISSWEDPRQDAQAIYELQSLLIERLSVLCPLTRIEKNMVSEDRATLPFMVPDGRGYLSSGQAPEEMPPPPSDETIKEMLSFTDGEKGGGTPKFGENPNSNQLMALGNGDDELSMEAPSPSPLKLEVSEVKPEEQRQPAEKPEKPEQKEDTYTSTVDAKGKAVDILTLGDLPSDSEDRKEGAEPAEAVGMPPPGKPILDSKSTMDLLKAQVDLHLENQVRTQAESKRRHSLPLSRPMTAPSKDGNGDAGQPSSTRTALLDAVQENLAVARPSTAVPKKQRGAFDAELSRVTGHDVTRRDIHTAIEEYSKNRDTLVAQLNEEEEMQRLKTAKRRMEQIANRKVKLPPQPAFSEMMLSPTSRLKGAKPPQSPCKRGQLAAPPPPPPQESNSTKKSKKEKDGKDKKDKKEKKEKKSKKSKEEEKDKDGEENKEKKDKKEKKEKDRSRRNSEVKEIKQIVE